MTVDKLEIPIEVQIDDEEINKIKKAKELRFFNSFMKVLVFIVVFHGLICISLSYVLAFMGFAQVVESLSATMVTEVVAPVTIYGITKTIENVSKYNNWVEKFTNLRVSGEDE